MSTQEAASASGAELVEQARGGDRAAFDALVAEHQPKLRGVVRRMVGHAQDTEDVVQEALLKAWSALPGFRGQSGFGTWLCSIGARAAIDHLRQQKRWRERAQVAYGNACFQTPELRAEIGAALSAPDFVFEVEEHIGYCFTCVGRSLEPEQQASLVLREVMGLSAEEGAAALGVSEPVFRHSLSQARQSMQHAFEGLCSLVNKQGVCYQCKGLRESVPEAQRGAPLPEQIADLDARLEIVRRADLETGSSQALHDLSWRRTREVEQEGRFSDEPATHCGHE